VAVTTITAGVEVETRPVTVLQASKIKIDIAKRKYFMGLMDSPHRYILIKSYETNINVEIILCKKIRRYDLVWSCLL
jgi:hypothetical protein